MTDAASAPGPLSSVGSVLVIDPDAAGRAQVLDALLGMAVTVDAVATLDEAPQKPWSLIVANYDRLSIAERAAFLARYEAERSAGRMLLLTATWDRRAFAAMFGQEHLMNIVACDRGLRVEDLRITFGKILSGDVFGLGRYFAPDAVRWRMALQTSSERHAVLERIVATLEAGNVQRRFVEQLRLAADELLTNAFFNAPTDESGARPFAVRHRSQEVELPAGQQIEAELVVAGTQVGLLVADPFGSLAPSTIVGYLGKCLRAGTDQVDEKEGGAGLGLFYVFEAVSHFVINVTQRQRTEMIGLLDASVRYREFALRPKSFNVFVGSSRA